MQPVNMLHHALARGILAPPAASASACLSHSQHALTALADRVWSCLGAQTSYSSTSANPGHTGVNAPLNSRSSPTPRLLARMREPAALQHTARLSAASTFSTAASAMPQQQQAPVSQGSDSDSAAAFEPGGADQGELIVEESAFKRLQQLSSKQGGKPVLLRVEVEGGGCSGFQYKFSLTDSINPDDKVFGSGPSKVVCDTVSLDLLRGAKVEFEDSLMRSAFVINSNPNADKSTSCGCGSSFSLRS